MHSINTARLGRQIIKLGISAATYSYISVDRQAAAAVRRIRMSWKINHRKSKNTEQIAGSKHRQAITQRRQASCDAPTAKLAAFFKKRFSARKQAALKRQIGLKDLGEASAAMSIRHVFNFLA